MTTPMLSDQEYLDKDGTRCPCCNSEAIEGRGWNSFGTTASQEIVCLDCDASWWDIYVLTGYELIENIQEPDVTT